MECSWVGVVIIIFVVRCFFILEELLFLLCLFILIEFDVVWFIVLLKFFCGIEIYLLRVGKLCVLRWNEVMINIEVLWIVE